jgi:hypothetical protein
VYGSCFFPEWMSNCCQGLHCTFSDICTKFDDVSMSDPLQNHTRPDTRLLIKGQNSARSPSCMKFCTLTPEICSTIIYCLIATLQLLYRWQRQSRKLWTPLVISAFSLNRLYWSDGFHCCLVFSNRWPTGKIDISLPLVFSVFCAAYWCFFKTLLVFSTLCRFLNFKL